MWVIAVEDSSEVVGFRLFAGYGSGPELKLNLQPVVVVSFEKEQKCILGFMYQTFSFAESEAARHTQLIKETLGKEYVMYPMSLEELDRRLKAWS